MLLDFFLGGLRRVVAIFRAERAGNDLGYRLLVRKTMLPLALIIPGLGLILAAVGQSHSMSIRLAVSGASIILWLLLRDRRRWHPIHTAMVLVYAAVVLVWFPWSLHAETDGHPVWQLHLMLFAMGLAIGVRSVHLIPVVAGGIGLLTLHGMPPFTSETAAVVATWSLAVWVAIVGFQRSIHLRMRLRREKKRTTRRLSVSTGFGALQSHSLHTPMETARKIVEELPGHGISPERVRLLAGMLERLRRFEEGLDDPQRHPVGPDRPRDQEIDLAKLLRCHEEGFALQARSRGGAFSLSVPRTAMLVHLDVVRMESALIALVTLAIRRVGPGGGVEVQARIRGGDLEFRVHSDGAGDYNPVEFTHAVRLARELAAEHAGSFTEEPIGDGGMLWTLVLAQVQQQDPSPHDATSGGDTSIAEFSGVGTSAVSDMSSTDGDPLSVVHPPPPAPGARHSVYALVVEDDAVMSELIVDMLKPFLHVVVARSGEEGLKLSRERPPDLLVTDLQLPGIDGIEMVRRLRSEPRFVDLPVLLLTGVAYPLAEVVRSIGHPWKVVAKPFPASKLRQAVRDLLQDKSLLPSKR